MAYICCVELPRKNLTGGRLKLGPLGVLVLAAFLALLVGACSRQGPDFSVLSSQATDIVRIQSSEYVYRDVLFQGRSQKFLGIFNTGESRVLFSVNYRVKAGIDADKGIHVLPLAIADPAGQPGVLLKLPASTILDIDVDESTIHQYFAQEWGLFSQYKISWLDVQDQLEHEKAHIRADAESRGILAASWDNATAALRELFRMAGFKTIQFEKVDSDGQGKTP